MTASASPTTDHASTATEPQPRVLLVVTSHADLGDTGKPTGFHLSELTHPHDVFRDAGYAIDFGSPAGGLPPMVAVDRKDPVNAAFLDDAAVMAALSASHPLASLDAADYDAVFFAGGHGVMWDFPDDPDVQRLAAGVYEHGGVVAAVCHGPAALVNVKLSDGSWLVEGKRLATFTNAEETAVKLHDTVPFLLQERFEAHGATVVPAENFAANTVVDGRLVTGQNPASATGTGLAVVEAVRATRH